MILILIHIIKTIIHLLIGLKKTLTVQEFAHLYLFIYFLMFNVVCLLAILMINTIKQPILSLEVHAEIKFSISLTKLNKLA